MRLESGANDRLRSVACGDAQTVVNPRFDFSAGAAAEEIVQGAHERLPLTVGRKFPYINVLRFQHRCTSARLAIGAAGQGRPLDECRAATSSR
jgi:hypothetical protein